MTPLEAVAAKLASEPHLWWGHTLEHAWVVLDRQDARNEGESRHLIRCRDWSVVEVSRVDFSSDRFVWFKNYIGRLPDDQSQEACSQLLRLRGEFAPKAEGFRVTKAALERQSRETERQERRLTMDQECQQTTAALQARLTRMPKHTELLEACSGTELTYEELLNTAEWHARRIQVLVRDRYECQHCGCEGTGVDNHVLQIHHRYYVINKLPWDYPDDALMTLCKECHTKLHEAGHVLVYEEVEGKLVRRKLKPCIRCLGAGFFPQWEHIEAGICFRCRGARFDVEVYVKEEANSAEQNATADRGRSTAFQSSRLSSGPGC